MLDAAGHYSMSSVADAGGSVLFCGPRVRMAIVSGVVDVRTVHKVTGRVEFGGAVMSKLQALAEAPDGGQVRPAVRSSLACIQQQPCKGAASLF